MKLAFLKSRPAQTLLYITEAKPFALIYPKKEVLIIVGAWKQETFYPSYGVWASF